jgi:hypothetical protein
MGSSKQPELRAQGIVLVIGVISREKETRAVEEFFQLFKTPWEFYVPHNAYDVVLATSEALPAALATKVLIIYNSQSVAFEGERRIASDRRRGWVEFDGFALPIYGYVAVFQEPEEAFLRLRYRSEITGYTFNGPARRTTRIGYDLFQEVLFLLSEGQPPENAPIPTLEIHISLLRKCILESGIPIIEVPPVPAGCDFMGCLTHDVDFTGIREHKFDATMWGFIYRALVGSLFRQLRGRLGWSKLFKNWKAVFSLPFVHLGLRSDFWLEFDRYMQIEQNMGSTFFFIPFKNVAGHTDSGPAPWQRAAPYELSQVRKEILELVAHGCEVGLHGIDAWRSFQSAQTEASRIREITKQPGIGVRMHWLYFAERSPKTLEEAGFSYDSTFGYNDAVGFRAGTTQVFRPEVADDLLELPLNIQDTAMFYPRRMGLSEKEALDSCKQLVGFSSLFGGVLTVNWHTRSLSPERLWGDFYVRLLKLLQTNRVWFGTAEQIVTWFRQRRALRFEQVQFAEKSVRVKLTGPVPDGRRPFLVRIHHPKSRSRTGSAAPSTMSFYSDSPWTGEAEMNIAS